MFPSPTPQPFLSPPTPRFPSSELSCCLRFAFQKDLENPPPSFILGPWRAGPGCPSLYPRISASPGAFSTYPRPRSFSKCVLFCFEFFSLFLFPSCSLPYIFSPFLSSHSFSISQMSQHATPCVLFYRLPLPFLSLLLPCCFLSFLFSSLPHLPISSCSAPLSLSQAHFPAPGERAHHVDPVGVGHVHARALPAAPSMSPSYQLRHGARSTLIGCLSWWPRLGGKMPSPQCQTDPLSPVCVNRLSPVDQGKEDVTLGDLKSQNPKDKVLAAASERTLRFVWRRPHPYPALPSTSGRIECFGPS